jgi:hypothetical protein
VRQSVAAVVVVPVGPGCREEFVADTVESALFYMAPGTRVLLADNSFKGTGRRVRERFPDGTVDVLVTEEHAGKFGKLYVTLAVAFAHALDAYDDFPVLLRMDTDALVTGPRPEADAAALFAAEPAVGIAGQYPNWYDGTPTDWSWPREQVLKQSGSLRSLVTHPRRGLALRDAYKRAAANGYEAGVHVFGGAYFVSRDCLERLRAAGLLPRVALGDAYLQEDHLFGLLVKAVGKEMGDLASRDGPFACAWQDLPAPPDEVLRRGKKVVHSTRRCGNLGEEEIRAAFRAARQGAQVPAVSAA